MMQRVFELAYIYIYIYIYIYTYIYIYVCVCVCGYVTYNGSTRSTKIWIRETDIGNPKYTIFTKLVQVRNFITFELKFTRHEERVTRSFYADCFYICPKPHAALHLQTTGLASTGPESQPSRSDAGIHCFSQIPKILSASGDDIIHFPRSYFPSRNFFFLTSVNDTSSSHAREHLR